jgi:hypothetical protein
MKKLLPALILVVTGCDVLGIGSPYCTTSLEPAILVDVSDSITGQPVRGRYPVIARSGAYADTADLETSPFVNPDTLYFGPFPLAYERGGRYDVEVKAPQYRVWSQSGIRVTEGECHVRTIRVAARLQRI